MNNCLKTLHGNLKLPTFFPDGTVGVVRGVDSKDLAKVKVEGVVTSTFHLLVHGIKSDLHQIMDWWGIILTDSGGFQVYSLLRDHPESGDVGENGFHFNWNGKKIVLTPEKSIQLQFNLGADILICLDQCTDPGQDFEFQKMAVERTIKWARRCKTEFEKQLSAANRQPSDKGRPLLFAVVQGGNFKELRKKCAEELIKIGFDGYCFGGWPIDKNKILLREILEFSAKLMPGDKPKYALGVGKPEDIVKCFKMGYTIFDCVIPTREARHKRLYVFEDRRWKVEDGKRFYSTLAVNSKFANDSGPIDKNCGCFACRNFSRGELLDYFRNRDLMAWKLATVHNLRFYTELMEKLKLNSQ